jgi:threonine dehydrogenase-like Zn-dependent dehydrogenase
VPRRRGSPPLRRGRHHRLLEARSGGGHPRPKVGVDSSIEALGSAVTLANCIKVTRPGGTISNVGYHGHGDVVAIPRLEWGVGMSDKTLRTGLCPGGAERMKRLLRLLVTGRIDPTPMTTHRFRFDQIEKAFKMMQTKEDGILKPLITFSGEARPSFLREVVLESWL